MYVDGATDWQKLMAKDIVELLSLCYPGWSWGVHVYGDDRGGGYHIKLLEYPQNYGYNNPKAHMCHSASEFRAQVLRAGGELLERCGAPRRKMEDDQPLIGRMEGVPEKFQPDSKLPSPQFQKVIAAAEREMREESPHLEKK